MGARGRGGGRAVVGGGKIVHAADIAADLDTDPAGPGLLAIGLGGLDVEDDDYRLLDRGRFVYDALYAWCQRQVTAPASPAPWATTTSAPLPSGRSPSSW